jgi:hypothetical protein
MQQQRRRRRRSKDGIEVSVVRRRSLSALRGRHNVRKWPKNKQEKEAISP